MGLFNFVRNAYRAITGNISVEQEQGYKKWLSEREANTGVKSNYNGKITYALKRENMDVQKKLQALINKAEGRNTEEMYLVLQKTSKTYAPYIAKHYQNAPGVGQIQRALSLEKMREEQAFRYLHPRGSLQSSLQNAIINSQLSNAERLATKERQLEKQIVLRKMQSGESASREYAQPKKLKPSFSLRPYNTIFDALGLAQS